MKQRNANNPNPTLEVEHSDSENTDPNREDAETLKSFIIEMPGDA